MTYDPRKKFRFTSNQLAHEALAKNERLVEQYPAYTFSQSLFYPIVWKAHIIEWHDTWQSRLPQLCGILAPRVLGETSWIPEPGGGNRKFVTAGLP